MDIMAVNTHLSSYKSNIICQLLEVDHMSIATRATIYI